MPSNIVKSKNIAQDIKVNVFPDNKMDMDHARLELGMLKRACPGGG